MLADDGRLSDHDAGSVIHEEIFADRRAGMNIDSRMAVRIFRHHAGNQRNAQEKQLVCDAVRGDRHESRITQDDFRFIVRRRISLEKGLQIRVEIFPHLRNALQERNHYPLRAGAQGLLRDVLIFRPELQCDHDLLLQIVADVLDQKRNTIVIPVDPERLLPVISRIENDEYLLQDVLHHFCVGLTEHIHLVHIPLLQIVPQNVAGRDLNPVLHFLHAFSLPAAFGGLQHRLPDLLQNSRCPIWHHLTIPEDVAQSCLADYANDRSAAQITRLRQNALCTQGEAHFP